MSLHNKQVLITGGSNGIGESIASHFLNCGAYVIVFDIEEPEYKCKYHSVDITNENKVNKATNKINKLDILINNAGIYRHTPINKFDESDFQDIFNTNVKAYRLMYTKTLDLLKNSDDGNVICISSGLSKRPEPYSDLYSASKSAINTLKTCWANSYEKTGVRSNSILPGPVNTKMLESNFEDDELNDYKNKQPTRKFVQKEHIAQVAQLLATNQSMNGAEISVGGESKYNQYGL